MQSAHPLFLFLGASNGFLAVALGAFAAHGLRNSLEPRLLETFQTGVQYHMYHALALILVALLASSQPSTLVRTSGYLFALGILLFSGSLYALSLTGIRWLGAITPIGGLAFLAAWACLCWAAVAGQGSN